MNRQEMTEQLEWSTGWGYPTFGQQASWDSDSPGPGKSDLKSVVSVTGPPDKYTDDELAQLVAFSQQRTTEYDAENRYRRGANVVIVDKSYWANGLWMVKRLLWQRGYPWHSSLEGAIGYMEGK